MCTRLISENEFIAPPFWLKGLSHFSSTRVHVRVMAASSGWRLQESTWEQREYDYLRRPAGEARPETEGGESDEGFGRAPYTAAECSLEFQCLIVQLKMAGAMSAKVLCAAMSG